MDISKIDKNFKAQEVVAVDGKKTYPIPSAYFSLYGVNYDAKEKCFLRMPLDVAAKVSDGVESLASYTAGGRLSFKTNSKIFAISVTHSGLRLMVHMAVTGSTGFSLFENTAEGERFIANLTPQPQDDEAYTASVNLAGDTLREYVLYFPLYNLVNSLSVTLDENAVVERGNPYRDIAPILYYGSSITQGGCASRPDTCYQGIICKRNRIDFINLGFSGNARAEKEMVAYMGGVNCSLFVCDYDHNAPSVAHLKATHYPLYKQFREMQPNTPILFITKPDIMRDVNGEERLKIIRSTYLKAKKEGDKNVYFLSGKTFYGKRSPENFAVDGCHPTDYGFAVMADKIYKKMCAIDKKFSEEKYD